MDHCCETLGSGVAEEVRPAFAGDEAEIVFFAIATAIPLRSGVVPTQPQITASSHLLTGCPVGWEFLVKSQREVVGFVRGFSW